MTCITSIYFNLPSVLYREEGRILSVLALVLPVVPNMAGGFSPTPPLVGVFATTSPIHSGQFEFRTSHCVMHSSWNACRSSQGSSNKFSPSSNWVMQMEHMDVFSALDSRRFSFKMLLCESPLFILAPLPPAPLPLRASRIECMMTNVKMVRRIKMRRLAQQTDRTYGMDTFKRKQARVKCAGRENNITVRRTGEAGSMR